MNGVNEIVKQKAEQAQGIKKSFKKEFGEKNAKHHK